MVSANQALSNQPQGVYEIYLMFVNVFFFYLRHIWLIAVIHLKKNFVSWWRKVQVLHTVRLPTSSKLTISYQDLSVYQLLVKEFPIYGKN